MTRLIFGLSLRQLLSQRRTLLLSLLALVPLLVAIIFRITADAADEPREFVADGLFSTVIVGFLLPMIALVFGTTAVGQEFEDGTAVYLLAKPIPRWKIVVAKIAAAWLATSIIVVICLLSSGLVVLFDEPQDQIIPAFTLAAVIGALVYVSFFVCLSIRFGRALIIGAAYVFLGEALLAEFLPGAQYFSVGEFTLGIADALADTAPRFLDARLDVLESVLPLIVVFTATLVYGIRLLNRIELGDREG